MRHLDMLELLYLRGPLPKPQIYRSQGTFLPEKLHYKPHFA